ncbi:MAG: YciI family protein [Bacillota bacterium]|nr:YciI family protein [Bacillota bacterium]
MEKKQYLYKLRLMPNLVDEKNWTEKENKIVQEHFEALEVLLEENKLIMAGRTQNFDASTFGIVILQVDSEEEARSLMEKDPAVAGNVMTAELFPYKVALYNHQFSNN